MAWMSKSSKALYYGLEYTHPLEAEDEFIQANDYMFSYDDAIALEIVLRILENMVYTHPDLMWSDPDEHTQDGYFFFSCKPSTYNHIEYTMDAWTDGWGYSFEVFE